MYGIEILGSPEKPKHVFRKFSLRPHSESHNSPTVFRFESDYEAHLGLKALIMYRVKARLVFHI